LRRETCLGLEKFNRRGWNGEASREFPAGGRLPAGNVVPQAKTEAVRAGSAKHVRTYIKAQAGSTVSGSSNGYSQRKGSKCTTGY